MVSAAPASTSQDSLLEALKRTSRALLDAVGNMRRQLQASESSLALAEMKIQVLEERCAKQRIEQYGPKSDALPNAQLELLDLEPRKFRRSRSQKLSASRSKDRGNRTRRSAGRIQAARLPPICRVWSASCLQAEQSVCQRCGNETAVIGYDASEMLDVEPASTCASNQAREARLQTLRGRDCGTRP